MKNWNRKLKLVAAGLALAVGFQAVAPKKAEAGIVVAAVVAPVTSGLWVIGTGVAAAGIGFGVMAGADWEPSSSSYESNGYGFGVFMTVLGIGLVVLDTNPETMAAALSKKFTSVEPYVLTELAHQISTKEKATAVNDKGVKEIIFTDAEADDVLSLSSTGKAEEIAKIKSLLTSKVDYSKTESVK